MNNKSVIGIFKMHMHTTPPVVGDNGATTCDSIVCVFPYSGEQPSGTVMPMRTLITLCNGETYASPWSQRDVENAMRHD